MKVTWLGQAGLLIETDSTRVIIDPYFSDSCLSLNPLNYRRMPINKQYLDVDVDIYIVTHNHMDHADPETMTYFLNRENSVTFLGPMYSWEQARKFGGNNNYVMFNRGTVWTHHELVFTAVKAEHSDSSAIGILIDDGMHTFYITGDTLYNKQIFDELPQGIDAVFLPINGVGNNMNLTDAAKFAKQTGAQKVVPLHWGMFDDINPEDFDCENKVIPQIYREINL